MKSYGNIWLVAVAHIAGASEDARGLLYAMPDGEILLCDNDSDAPGNALYIARLEPDADPLHVAARLRHVLDGSGAG